MAIDTANKRNAAIGIPGLRQSLPIPSGSIDDISRAMLVRLYVLTASSVVPMALTEADAFRIRAMRKPMVHSS
jgi:hypothetical protein